LSFEAVGTCQLHCHYSLCAGSLFHFKKDHAGYSIKAEDYETKPLFISSKENRVLNEFWLSNRSVKPHSGGGQRRSGAIANLELRDVATRGPGVGHTPWKTSRLHPAPLIGQAAEGYTHIEIFHDSMSETV
jgi:hypothetical protein